MTDCFEYCKNELENLMFGQMPFQAPKNLFLLNPRHDGFISGEKRKFQDMTFSSGCFLYGFIAIFIVIPLIIGGLAVQELNIRAKLDQSGVTTSATVTDQRISTSTDSKGRRSTSYYITYKFYAGQSNNDSPVLYTSEQLVSSDTYNNTFDGGSIDIRYLPDDPKTSRIMNDNVNDPKIMLFFMAIFLAIPILFIYFTLRNSGRNRRMESEGQIITGRITEAKLTRIKSNYQLALRYTFTSPEGEELSKKESRVRNDLRNGGVPAEGTPVAVVYVHSKLYRML
jgi:uncharacterized protein DUF3592